MTESTSPLASARSHRARSRTVDQVLAFAESLGSGAYGITSIADALGHTETFTYNSSNQITTITSASGRALHPTWTSGSSPHVTAVVLVSDTLLLTHYMDRGEFHHLDIYERAILRQYTAAEERRMVTEDRMGNPLFGGLSPYPGTASKVFEGNHRRSAIGVLCPDLSDLGRWLLDAEPILKAGLAWYLPCYVLRTESEVREGMQSDTPFAMPRRAQAVDFLVENRRAIEVSGAEPIKSQLVRPILSMDLPFIDGASLRDFSQITVSEFASYSGFRDYLRKAFLDLDDSMNAVQSERELVKIGLEIKQQVKAARSDMERACRKRAVTVTGAALGSVSAILCREGTSTTAAGRPSTTSASTPTSPKPAGPA